MCPRVPSDKEEKGGGMAEVTYFSKVRVEPVKGKIRRAYLPAVEEPVMFAFRGALAARRVSFEEVGPDL
jgi:hypothetical protein